MIYTSPTKEFEVPTITLTITVPDDATFSIDAGDVATTTTTTEAPDSTPSPEEVERYWRDYLSDNGRALYAAAAAIEHETRGVFTLNDVAQRMEAEYSSAQSIHRTTGRSARRWNDQTGLEPPIRLDWMDYAWNDDEQGMRTQYQLPEGIADLILGFAE
jgi:predicted flap endonuclease-1-like 5' DNA nuclease